MPRTALSEIENGGRRVNVDDLMALAIALGANPNALLFPLEAGTTPIEITGADDLEFNRLWRWAEGTQPLASGTRRIDRSEWLEFLGRISPRGGVQAQSGDSAERGRGGLGVGIAGLFNAEQQLLEEDHGDD